MSDCDSETDEFFDAKEVVTPDRPVQIAFAADELPAKETLQANEDLSQCNVAVGDDTVCSPENHSLDLEEELQKWEEERRKLEERQRQEEIKLQEKLAKIEEKKKRDEDRKKEIEVARNENAKRRKKLEEARRRMQSSDEYMQLQFMEEDDISCDSEASASESSATVSLPSALPTGPLAVKPESYGGTLECKQQHVDYDTVEIPECQNVNLDIRHGQVSVEPDIVASTRSRSPNKVNNQSQQFVPSPTAPPRARRHKKVQQHPVVSSLMVEAHKFAQGDNVDTVSVMSDDAPNTSLGLPEPGSNISLKGSMDHSLDIMSATLGDSFVHHGVDDGVKKGEGAPSVDDPVEAEQKLLMKGISKTGVVLTEDEILAQIMVKNLDTGEAVPLGCAEDSLPKGINPLTLHIMKLTSEFPGETEMEHVKEESDEDEGERLKQTDHDKHLHIDKKAVKMKTAKFRKYLGKKVGKTYSKIKSMADEVLHGEEVVSDDDEMTAEMIRTGIKIKASSSHKGPYTFDQVLLVQDMSSEHTGPVWIVKFSHCGRLLATAGQDNKLRVWVLKEAYSYFSDMRLKYASGGSKISPSPSQDSLTLPGDEKKELTPPLMGPSCTILEDEPAADIDVDKAPFVQQPFCVYEGHVADLLDVSWSKNYFILSSSMDKTVRLWHISRKECLCCFQHIDFVTAIAFHPRDDRYFLSGSLDGKLRLWNIPEKKVALWNEVDGQTKLITAANFCQNGRFAVIGTYDGRCIFYSTELLKYFTQIHVRSSRGKNRRGSKISGIEPLPGENKILITSNDSRIRLYDLRDLSLACKYKGLTNTSSQIKASLSQGNKFIACASEDHYVYLWRTNYDYSKFSSARRDRNDYWEAVKIHNAVVTAAVFAPNPILYIKDDARPGRSLSDLTDPVTKELKRRPSVVEKDKNVNRGQVLVTADFTGAIKVLVTVGKSGAGSLPRAVGTPPIQYQRKHAGSVSSVQK